jgi:hypothetical protein
MLRSGTSCAALVEPVSPDGTDGSVLEAAVAGDDVPSSGAVGDIAAQAGRTRPALPPRIGRMRPGRFLLVAFAVASGWCAAASARGAQTPTATLPSRCSDQQVAPVSVVLTCADAGFIAERLSWADWGAPAARATGVASVNTCVPDCATGGREEYPVELVADRLRDCDYGERQYTRVTYRFPAESPFPPGSTGDQEPTVEFSCPARPHSDPRVTRMHLRLSAHQPPGSRYFVGVHVRLRICAVRGPVAVVVNESKRAGGETFGEHTRTLRHRQRARCQTRTFSWKLRDEFFGVGTYKVTVTAWDKDAQFSKSVSRRVVTID